MSPRPGGGAGLITKEEIAMTTKCPKCGSEKIMKGELSGFGGFVFIPESEKGAVKKSSYITAGACKDCGAVFDISLADKPNKLTDR